MPELLKLSFIRTGGGDTNNAEMSMHQFVALMELSEQAARALRMHMQQHRERRMTGQGGGRFHHQGRGDRFNRRRNNPYPQDRRPPQRPRFETQQ